MDFAKMKSVISTIRRIVKLSSKFDHRHLLFFFQRWCPIGWRAWWTPTRHWLLPSSRWLPWRTVTAPIPSSRASPHLKCPVTTWTHMVSIIPSSRTRSGLLPEAEACVRDNAVQAALTRTIPPFIPREITHTHSQGHRFILKFSCQMNPICFKTISTLVPRASRLLYSLPTCKDVMLGDTINRLFFVTICGTPCKNNSG